MYVTCNLELIATRAFKRVLYIKPMIRLVLRHFSGCNEYLPYLVLVNIKFTYYKDIQYSHKNFTLALRIVHLQADQKFSVR